MTEAQAPRWRHRFQNFDRALGRLRESVELMRERPLSDLERDGLVRRYRTIWAPAWKTMRDLLEHDGVSLPTVIPRAAIQAAFGAGLVANGEAWMQALDARNCLSHTYSGKAFEAAVADIEARFLALFEALHERLTARAAADA